MYFPKQFDVIVVGGGHAGVEAALAAARMGKQTLLVTQNFDTLGQLSCNPSIGGIGKGHLVREVDAMGGAMALSADEAGIQFRILNSSKGPAVRATRAQIDRNLYRQSVRFRLENQKNLFLFQQQVDDLIVNNYRAEGVVTEGKVHFSGKSIVLSAGTFLDGKIYVGLHSHPGGRAGDAPAVALAHRLRDMDLPRGRLKTGTPPRIDGRTVDFTVMERQDGDTDPVPVFSFLGNPAMHPSQLPCWITHTNPETHEIIRGGLDRSPLFTGMIEGVGPRYCPSIEDKIHRFSDKSSHQIFLEPEGLRTHEYYPNGISTSLPFDTQIALVHSMKGMEKAHILRPGYAIEYDYFDPRSLKTSLETRQIAGLFFAGQINGTTGYEEAAAQGLVAGINACRYVEGEEAWVPKRSEAYIGVMLDDLVTRGVQEPYRMFTSRAEYRLSLREDNADIRLTETAYKLGCISQAHWERFEKKREQIARELERMKSTWVHPCMLYESEAVRVLGRKPEKEYSLTDLLKRPDVNYASLMTLTSTDGQNWAPKENLEKAVREQVEIQIKYAGYIERQERDVRRQQYYENLRLPDDLPYADIPALSVEVRQRLEMHRPETLGQASRISGVTPAAVSLLLVYLKKRGLVHFSGDKA